MFRNEISVRGVYMLLRFSERKSDGAREVEGSLVWLVRVDACVAIVVRSLTEQEVRGDLRQTVFADKQGKVL